MLTTRELTVQTVRLWVCVVIVALLVQLRAQPGIRLLLESLVLLGALVFVARRPAIGRLIRQLSRRQRTVIAVSVALLFGVQLCSGQTKAFPLTRWSMYAESLTGPVAWYELTARLDDGSQRPLPMGSGIRNTRMSRVIRLFRLLDQLEAESDVNRRIEVWAELRRGIAAHAARFEAEQGVHVVGVRVERCRWPFDQLADPGAIRREQVRDIPLN
jgi:hypothetical protein